MVKLAKAETKGGEKRRTWIDTSASFHSRRAQKASTWIEGTFFRGQSEALFSGSRANRTHLEHSSDLAHLLKLADSVLCRIWSHLSSVEERMEVSKALLS